MADPTVRPTKKQREILSYIEGFIAEHGYSPSYREIMNGLDYTSVATVSLHVNSLIKRGHLVKRDRSARSLEVVHPTHAAPKDKSTKNPEEKWLDAIVAKKFAACESMDKPPSDALQQLGTVANSLEILGFTDMAGTFRARLDKLTEE